MTGQPQVTGRWMMNSPPFLLPCSAPKLSPACHVCVVDSVNVLMAVTSDGQLEEEVDLDKVVSKEDEAQAIELKAQANKAFAGESQFIYNRPHKYPLGVQAHSRSERLQWVDRDVHSGNLAQP